MTDRLEYGATEDRTMPAIVYALYLLAFATGVTVIVGLILAYAQQGSAGPKLRTHYTFLIRTFWMGIAWCVAGGLLFVVGLPLSFVLVGIPLLMLSWAIWALVGIWYAIRCIVGVIYLARDEAYPRPYAWLA
ncbi:DUF4870 family protein [Phenylobacterium sp.]|uniref:DUF4870 family protein n=1 Tax=Phenylobacterium sp. TaxID=1871053 RepID=UPI0035B44CD3